MGIVRTNYDSPQALIPPSPEICHPARSATLRSLPRLAPASVLDTLIGSDTGKKQHLQVNQRSGSGVPPKRG